MNYEESVGKNIKVIRKQKNITLKELADRTGFTKSYLSKIEKSKSILAIISTEKGSSKSGCRLCLSLARA